MFDQMGESKCRTEPGECPQIANIALVTKNTSFKMNSINACPREVSREVSMVSQLYMNCARDWLSQCSSHQIAALGVRDAKRVWLENSWGEKSVARVKQLERSTKDNTFPSLFGTANKDYANPSLTELEAPPICDQIPCWEQQRA